MSTWLHELWHDNKWYVLFGTITMITGFAVGILYPESVDQLIKGMLSQVKEIANNLKQKDNSLFTFAVIFGRNLLSCVLMMVFGACFAIFALNVLFLNGLLLGYVLSTMKASGADPVSVFIYGVLPHGILELPTVIFAASLGIRYGVLAFRSIYMIWQQPTRNLLKQKWKTALKQFPRAVLVIGTMLFFAAVIESFITPLLLNNLLPQ
ncbi:stage II sporulation protein M [Brevibacillus dissolubilis]|uniref:stage II sporulation protein M n=1 Tax=Brevibacillus dissolubilis TaxID=1844116 RepID=UPI00159B8C5E|nr:stage II sporulation protein M [Brevibacillus dissolubilis]